MTSARMESLNRRLRIIQRIKAGERYSVIAKSEGVVQQYVSTIGVRAGIRKQNHRRIPPPTVWQMTPAEATWRRISDTLDRWNREHHRV